MSLTHFDGKGDAHMVDVSDKPVTSRIAVAETYIKMQRETFDIITEGRAKKGDVMGVARLAGIMAAKRTADLIPLCHPLMLSKIDVNFELDEARHRIKIESLCKLSGQTGVEMEALTAVSVAALTLFDMAKALDPMMEIQDIKVMHKQGGKSGDWSRKND